MGLGRFLLLAPMPARLGFAIALRALGCLLDATAFAGIALSGQGEPLGPAWLPAAIAIGGVASLLVASAIGGIGRRLDAPVVVRDSRWILATFILAGGSMFAALATERGERLHESSVVCAVAVMCAAALAVQLLHARLAGNARAAIAADLARATVG
jgi:hypothetical protein